MVPLTIKKCAIEELQCEQQLPELLEEYAAECAIEGLPKPAAKMEMYRHLQAAGALTAWGAFITCLNRRILIGFITVLSPVLPHYGVCVSTVESFFVGEPSRRTGAGMKLLDLAAAHAREIGSPGMLISAPLLSNLFSVLHRRKNCKQTGAVFFERFVDA